jgi:hypothetical protein
MRSVPLGVLPSINEVLEVAKIQAIITHDTIDGILSSQAVALMSYFGLQTNLPFSRLPKFMSDHLPEFDPDEIEFTEVRGPRVGFKTAVAVYKLLLSEGNLLGVLRQTIEWGGDTDSVAAIAMGIGSCRMNGEELPDFFEYGLEPGRKYGPIFLKKLGAELMEKYR